ncbi:hypothetical protein HDU67_008111, partial [Dinochytrium kinnereticum]
MPLTSSLVEQVRAAYQLQNTSSEAGLGSSTIAELLKGLRGGVQGLGDVGGSSEGVWGTGGGDGAGKALTGSAGGVLMPMRITPSVIAELARMAEETDVFKVVKGLYIEQAEKENFLLSQRKILLSKHEKRRDQLMAEEIINSRIPKSKSTQLEQNLVEELKKFDAFMHKEMMRLWKRHQREMEMANVPLFRDTDNPSEVQMQRKIVAMLVDMMPA